MIIITYDYFKLARNIIFKVLFPLLLFKYFSLLMESSLWEKAS